MLHIILSLILPFLLGNNTETTEKPEDLSSWHGIYHFEEDPVKANADYYMVMDWKLTIGFFGKGEEHATLSIHGQQTEIILTGIVSGNNEKISITLNESASGTDEDLKSGDLLLTLTKTEKGIVTAWGKLKPRLVETANTECDCFVKQE